MNQTAVNPTAELYSQIQAIAEHFNNELFDGELPPVMFVLERGKSTSGYFSPSRWRHNMGAEVGEIALNPSHFADKPIIHLFQTIAHELCHLWQHEFGGPVRKSYHNNEWSNKMIGIGLMPSSTGAPGGSRTGQRMSDYPIDGGKFLAVCAELMDSDFFLSWVDQGTKLKSLHMRSDFQALKIWSESESKLYVPVREFFPDFKSEDRNEISVQKQKIRYHCRSCGIKVWGKKDLLILCADCNSLFEQAS